jgi:hypothetical protein
LLVPDNHKQIDKNIIFHDPRATAPPDTLVMDPNSNQAQQLHTRMKHDHGNLSWWTEEEVLKLVNGGLSEHAIDGAYREDAERYERRLKNHAYESLKRLREELGYCDAIKEETLLAWIKEGKNDEELEREYRRKSTRIANKERAERIWLHLISLPLMASQIYETSVDQVLDALEISEQSSDEEVIQYLSGVCHHVVMSGDYDGSEDYK